eukprot:TRINITY_DN23074_c0_g1_i1.p1 TRINITY_DN23074_c0_g1~~TRINITY_DN23074_c0_g1_i1.p1  ORF type:complete len:603 (-),score=103.32 TRINITY_DN23074_c0_g1_i1:293-2101(-)
MAKQGLHSDLSKYEQAIGVLRFDQEALSPAAATATIPPKRNSRKGSKTLATEVLSAGYGYRVVNQTVKGLTPETAKQPSADLFTALKSAVTSLDAAGVVGICAESALMLPLQPQVRSLTGTPVFLSSLLQVSLLVPAHHTKQKFAIVTKYENELQDAQHLNSMLKSCGIEILPDRFVVVGVPEQDPCMIGQQKHASVLGNIQLLKAEMPDLSGVICDCVELITSADELRAVTRLPVFDQVTLMDYFHSARSDNIYFGTSYAHLKSSGLEKTITKAQRRVYSPYDGYVKSLASSVERNALIGVLRLDYSYPLISGDQDYEASYGYRVKYATVENLTFEKARRAVLDSEIQLSFKKAVSELERRGAIAITGDCAFLMAYQPYVRSLTKLPVLLSSIIQAPMMVAANDSNAQFAVITANSSTFDKDLLLAQSGVEVPPAQWTVVGLQDLPGFQAVTEGKQVPKHVVQPALVRQAKEVMARTPNLRAILLECTELPHCADALRAATGLPVFDAITAADYFQNSCAEGPGYSKKCLESVLGVLNPCAQATTIAVVTAGALGKVVTMSGKVVQKKASMLPQVRMKALFAAAKEETSSKAEHQQCCTMM